MPRGDNPNSKRNLQKFGSEREARESGSKGGIASGESRRATASITEAMKTALTPERAMKIAEVVIKRAEQGNLKAYELLRDQMGEKPTEKIAVSTINEESMSKLQKAIEKRRADETVTE